jgi:tetratricopeptide (TPR) repeat protein
MLKNLIKNNSVSGDTMAEPLIILIRDSNNNPEYLSMIDSLIQKKTLNKKNLNLLLLRKADILEQSGKFKDAEKAVLKILSSDEKSLMPFALYKSASILARTGNKSKAIEHCRTILKKYNKSTIYPAALLKTGILLLEDKKTRQESLIYFKQLTARFQKTPESKTAAFYMAYIDFLDNNYPKAQEQLISLQKKLKSINENSLSINTHIYLIWTYIKQKKTDEALKVIQDSPEKFLIGAPENFLQDFAEYFKKIKPVQAEKALTVLLKADNPVTRQRALIKLAELQIPDRKKAAEHNIKKALDLNADKRLTQIARFKLAELLMYTGKKEEAVLLFEKCLENPIDKNIAAKARLGLAEILSYDKERLLTANRYAMSVFILSKDAETASKAMLLSIKLSIKLKNKTEAQSTFKELQSRFPEIAKTKTAQKLKKMIDALQEENKD